MKAAYIDVERGTAEFVDIRTDLDTLYKLCRCECIAITRAFVMGVPYTIVADDEGWLRETPKVAVYDTDGRPKLVGSVLFFADSGEELEGLSRDDEERLRMRLGCVRRWDGGWRHVILVD